MQKLGVYIETLWRGRKDGGGGAAREADMEAVEAVAEENLASQQAWPPPELGIDITGVHQISNGWARCVGVWLLDDGGNPAHCFEQGQTATFCWEFEVLHDMPAPVGGLVIANHHDLCVHGKSTLEYDTDVPLAVKAGAHLRFRQDVSLQLAVGKYQFEVGLTAISSAGFTRRRKLPHAELISMMSDLCDLKNVGAFEIVFRENPQSVQLMHHGIANLPGACRFSMVGSPKGSKRATVSTASQFCDEPAIFHITHWKAGSQWIYKVLKACAPDRVVAPAVGETEVRLAPRAGRIYPTVYMTRHEFNRLRLPENSRRFVVIRDLRDTLVSAYFSMKFSHPGESPNLLRLRESLASVGKDDGMLLLMDDWLILAARIQQSWLESGESIIRYEDLLDNDLDVFENTLVNQCGLKVDRQMLAKAVADNRFASLTGGRQRGEEDTLAHERKGIAGDWKNHMSEAVKRAFKIRFGGLLAATGYERDLDW